MCTIEMIENLKIENSTKIWVCAISPYHRRFVGGWEVTVAHCLHSSSPAVSKQCHLNICTRELSQFVHKHKIQPRSSTLILAL